MRSIITRLTSIPFISHFFKRDFLSYCIVGIIGLILDVSIYFFCYKVLELNYAVANIISSHIAIIHNFILNSIFTFKIKDKRFIRFFSFYGIALVGMAISTGLLLLFIDKLGMHPMLAKFITIGVVTVIQFTFNKFITFKKKEYASGDEDNS